MIFRDKMKIAAVCPIFKCGGKFDFSNYRSISLLPTFLKIYEKRIAAVY